MNMLSKETEINENESSPGLLDILHSRKGKLFSVTALLSPFHGLLSRYTFRHYSIM